MNEIVPSEPVIRPVIHGFLRRLLQKFRYKNETVVPIKNDVSSVDITNDITTYIRCIFHDLRGPINNISLGTELLLESKVKSREDLHILNGIRESCSFLSDSLDGFLNVNNGNIAGFDDIKMKYEPFNIIGLIKKIQYILLFSIMSKKINIKYIIIKPIIEWVIGDYKHIQHVLMNLLSNAIKNADDNSIIIIQLDCNIVSKKKQCIIMSIIDENVPIRSDIKAHLFEKYNTSDNIHGTGLGLYICKKIIELHGGKIDHYYNDTIHEKRGNIFKIEMILDTCSPGDMNISNIKSSKVCSGDKNVNNNVDISNHSMDIKQNGKMLTTIGKRVSTSSIFLNSKGLKMKGEKKYILIIDDSETTRKLMKQMIEKNSEGLNIYECVDGLDGVIKLLEYNENGIEISMILLDNVMPNITGELFCKIVRGMGYNGLIIGITGNGLEEDKEKFKKMGADVVYTKPITKEKLVDILRLIGCSEKD